MNRLGAVVLLALALFAPALHAQPADASPGERTAYQFVNNVVWISTRPADGSPGEDGFGFVFGARRQKLYIATADHVIMRDQSGRAVKPQVTFHDAQGEPVEATVLGLRLKHGAGDLAVLEVDAPAGFEPHWLSPVPTSDLQLGDHAWRIGKAERWVPSSLPGSFVQSDGAILVFDNLDTPRGSSGGPIVTAAGVLGMVIEDSGMSGGGSRVLSIETIRGKMRDWDLPWNLSGQPATPPPADQAHDASTDNGGGSSQPRSNNALAAGMQAPATYYGGENIDHGVQPQMFLRNFGIATWTPMSIPGGQLLYTTRLQAMMDEARAGRLKFVLIDALANDHAQTIIGAVRLGYAGGSGFPGDAAQGRLRGDLLRLTGGDQTWPIVVFCGGPSCWESYNAALRAIGAGFQNVLWYRGGIYAWEQAGLAEGQ